jgi:hypothetical protein
MLMSAEIKFAVEFMFLLSPTRTTVQLERYIDVGGNQVRRRVHVPVITNENDPEMACKVYEEFRDAPGNGRHHLDTGVLKFEFFRQCLAGSSRSHWDAIVDALPDNSNNSFDAGIAEWFNKYFKTTAFHDQKQYFLQAMSVKETATHVEEIMRLCSSCLVMLLVLQSTQIPRRK